MRPSWDEVYLEIAEVMSKRSECSRGSVGCVIVKDNSIVAAGINGFPPGEKNCLDDGICPRATNKEVKSGEGYAESGCGILHAEANAIIRAGRDKCKGATLYTNKEPCVLCAPLIRAVGIERVVVK